MDTEITRSNACGVVPALDPSLGGALLASEAPLRNGPAAAAMLGRRDRGGAPGERRHLCGGEPASAPGSNFLQGSWSIERQDHGHHGGLAGGLGGTSLAVAREASTLPPYGSGDSRLGARRAARHVPARLRVRGRSRWEITNGAVSPQDQRASS
jgi:hypothetical protein